MSYHNPVPVPAGSKSVNNTWAVTTEDVAGIMNESPPEHRAYDPAAFEALTDDDIKRVTDSTTDCLNFEHQTAMADYTLSLILHEKGFISRPHNPPDEADYADTVFAVDQYEDGECPDCGETIPGTAVVGDACTNCQHVFTEEREDDDIQSNACSTCGEPEGDCVCPSNPSDLAFPDDDEKPITTCKHCGCYVDPSLGADSPGMHQDRTGMKDSPRSPGEYDDICDICNYSDGKRGGPSASATYDGDHSEWQ